MARLRRSRVPKKQQSNRVPTVGGAQTRHASVFCTSAVAGAAASAAEAAAKLSAIYQRAAAVAAPDDEAPEPVDGDKYSAAPQQPPAAAFLSGHTPPPLLPTQVLGRAAAAQRAVRALAAAAAVGGRVPRAASDGGVGGEALPRAVRQLVAARREAGVAGGVTRGSGPGYSSCDTTCALWAVCAGVRGRVVLAWEPGWCLTVHLLLSLRTILSGRVCFFRFV